VACSITARTWAWVPLSRSTVNKSHAKSAWGHDPMQPQVSGQQPCLGG